MQISKNFSLQELTVSQTASRRGLSNQPNAAAQANLKRLCDEVLQPLRDYLKRSIIITSGYRSDAVNRAVGGSTTSAHSFGLAADLYVPGMTIMQVIHTIHGLGLPYDQIIDEFGSWVHVGLSANNRKQALKARYIGGKTVYSVMKL